ncbi:MAG: hypothetical protein DRP42_00370 [Tenericutes bacterium]|nr:MAG: hypothetical protein DRP42_00370 [Mycoplasmatota bacterium]
MQKETILELFDNHPIIEKSVAKFTVAQQQPYEARVQIFKTTNSGDRVSERQVNESLPSLLFNSQRYDLSRTGRYKLNMNLSVVPRIAGKVIAENIKDANGKVLVKAGTLIEAKQIEKLSAAIAENNVEYSTLQIDPALLNSVQIGEEKAKFHNLAHIVKVYQESNALKMLELGQEPTILKVIGNYHNDLTTLTISDIIATFGKFINLEEGMGTYDDIDSMSNRKIKSVYELLRNQFRMGLTKIQKNLRDRISAKDTTGLEVKKVTNFKLMESTLKEFFNSSQLSQFMDQINPLAEISNKRRITSLGPGGLSRDTASLVVRGIHDTHYGRIDPIETPEGPNIGLILNLALYARINEYGIIETPYFKVKNSKIQKSNPIFLTSDEESIYTIASGVVKTDAAGNITDKEVTARRNTKFVSVSPEEVNLIDVSPKQMVSIASAHIPFLENDDANRALMGANMQRQAVPLIKPDSPIVGTGIEQESAKATTSSVKAKSDGTVVSVEGATIVVKHGTRLHTYNLSKFLRSNQESAITQRPIVKEGQKVKEGEIIADGPSVDNGELAIGKNVVVAFTT